MLSQLPDHWLGRSLGEHDRYRLERRLGSGGMADVYLATDTLLQQPVALKLLHEKLVRGEFKERFEQEVALCAALKSDHIVQVSDHGVTSKGYPFYVMEYLQGQTLCQLLKQEKRLSVDRAIRIVMQVCTGLHLAHQGFKLCRPGATSSEHVTVVHRDLKPDNIFLVPMALGELVKILDFGIAKIHSDQIRLNATTMFLGTYRYAAPEQFEVGKELDERADIYSLGLILYEMLSGTDPFGFGATAHHINGGAWAVAHASQRLMPLRQQLGCKQLSPELETVVMRCLHKVPHQRFSSVDELRLAVQQFVVPDKAAGLSHPSAIWQPVEKPLTTSAYFKTAVSACKNLSIGFKTASSSLYTVLRKITLFKALPDEPLPTSAESLDQSALSSTLIVVGAAGVAALLLGLYSFQSATLSVSQITQQNLQPSQPIKQSLVQSSGSSIVRSLRGHAGAVWAIAISPLGEVLASGSFDKTVKIWNPKTGRLLRTLSGHSDAVRAIAISRDGSILASGSSDATIKIWNLQTGQLLRTLSGHRGAIWSVSISPDGQTLVSGAYDGDIKIWNLQTGELLNLPEHDDSVWSVDISPDGQTLVSGAYDGDIKIWNLQTRELLHTLSENHSEAIRSIAISSDGQTLVSGSWDKTVKVWDLKTGRLLHTLSGHSDRVVSVAINPTNQTIASGSIDRTIKLWDLKTGRLLRTFSGNDDWVLSVAFSANGETLASAGKDQTVKIWKVSQ